MAVSSKLFPCFVIACMFTHGSEAGDDATSSAAETAPSQPVHSGPVITEELIAAEEEYDTAVDRTHQYISNRADDLAIYLDSFFGNPISDIESADSNMRATLRYDWDDDKGSDWGVKLRGKVDLPAFNRRLSLVFDGEEGGSESGYSEEEEDNNVGFQYNRYDRGKQRLDFTMGLTSGPNLKPGVRYRYQGPAGENSRVRGIARLQYENEERFFSTFLGEYDHLIGTDSIVRWSNKVKYGERTQGAEWRSIVSYRHFYSEDSAWGIVAGVKGVTDAEDMFDELTGESLTKAYGAGLRFRNRLFRDWFYVEVSPGYIWRQSYPMDDRHGVYQIRVDFQIAFNRGRESPDKID